MGRAIVMNHIGQGIKSLFMGRFKPYVLDEMPPEFREVAGSNPKPFRFIGDLAGQNVTGIFLQAEEKSALDQMSGGLAVNTLDHLLTQVFDGKRLTGVNAAFTKNGPLPDRKMLIWQNSQASIDNLVMAANAMQIFLRDLGFTRHSPIELSIDKRVDNKVASDRTSSVGVKVGAEVKTPEFFLASASLSGESNMDLSQTKARESATSMNEKEDIVINGWAYNAGLVEAITHRLNIPSPKQLILMTEHLTINASIRGDVDDSIAPFESIHDHLINLERYALWVADQMNGNTGADRRFSQFVEMGDTEGALEGQLGRAKIAAEGTEQEHAEAEAKLAVTLCASIYRGAQYKIEAQLGQMVGNDILRAISKLYPGERKSGEMKAHVAIDTYLSGKPREDFHPVSDISEKTESMKTLDRIGLQAYYQVKEGLSEVDIVLFPRMTGDRVNLDSVVNTSVMMEKSNIDFKSTTVYKAFDSRRELRDQMEETMANALGSPA